MKNDFDTTEEFLGAYRRATWMRCFAWRRESEVLAAQDLAKSITAVIPSIPLYIGPA